MLDLFLKHAYKNEKTAAEEAEVEQLLSKLPLDVLHKLASGEMSIEELADNGGGEGGWLDKFKGTPLFQSAMDLEQRELTMEAAALQRDDMEAMNDRQKDKLQLEKKMLEMELAKQDAGMSEPGAANFVGDPPPEAPPAPGGPPMGGPPGGAPAEAGAPPPEAPAAEAPPMGGPPAAEPKMAEDKKRPLAERAGEHVGRHSVDIGTALGGIAGATKGNFLNKKKPHSAGRALVGAAAGALVGRVSAQLQKGHTKGLVKDDQEKAAASRTAPRNAKVDGDFSGHLHNDLRHAGKAMKKSVKKYGPKALVAGGAGAAVALGANHLLKKPEPEKKASQEDVTERMAKIAKGLLPSAAKAFIKKNPATALGAAAGAAGGFAEGSSGPDGSVMKGLVHGAGGAALGGAAGHVGGHMQRELTANPKLKIQAAMKRGLKTTGTEISQAVGAGEEAAKAVK